MAVCTRKIDASFGQPNAVITLNAETKIHTGFLYNNLNGYKLQQKLCLLLSGTKSSPLYGGWEEFAIALKLDPLFLNNIKYSFNQQDPTSYILLAFTQKEDSTIEDITEALTKIKRYDVLQQIQPLIDDLKSSITPNSALVNSKNILTPPSIPDCPFVFKSLAIENRGHSERLIVEKLQQSTPILNTPSYSYTKKVLLTYNSDADQIITKILEELRKPRDGYKLGVLVLQEHSQKISCSPEQSISDYFAQVDYVFPVITPKYIQDVTQNDTNSLDALANYDHKYAKYIYRLMNTNYIRQGCKNKSVRCLIPDEEVHHVLQHPIMDNSLFQLWVRISAIEDLINAILKEKI